MHSSELLGLTTLLLTSVNAQTQPLGLCTGLKCQSCPNAITTQGTGYPSCVIYDRDTVLGSTKSEYSDLGNGQVGIYWQVPAVDHPECRTIIRTPANTDDQNCGYPVYGGRGGVCTEVDTKSTLMVQFCCGVEDCKNAGAEKRSEMRAGERRSTTPYSAVFHHADGTPVMPLAVGHGGVDMMDQFIRDMGLNVSNTAAAIEKRNCNGYQPSREPYTKTGTASITVSDYICRKSSEVMITNAHSVSRTSSFSTTVSDPFGIVSASVGFSFEKSSSQSYSYSFTPEASQCGHVAWTPIYKCSAGTITGCNDGNQDGEVCTADRINDNQLNGIYHFVETG